MDATFLNLAPLCVLVEQLIKTWSSLLSAWVCQKLVWYWPRGIHDIVTEIQIMAQVCHVIHSGFVSQNLLQEAVK